MVEKQHLELRNPEAMEALGARVVDALGGRGLVFLAGDLGTGKTTLVRGALRHMGHQGSVKSPTFTLVEPYEINSQMVFHFDLYRLADPGELEFMGFRDYIAADTLCFVEWPERGAGGLPLPDIEVRLEYRGERRGAVIAAATARGAAVVAGIAGDGHGSAAADRAGP